MERYYLNERAASSTYSYNADLNRWIYDAGVEAMPLGAMYQDSLTPDGYLVNKNGAWIPTGIN